VHGGVGEERCDVSWIEPELTADAVETDAPLARQPVHETPALLEVGGEVVDVPELVWEKCRCHVFLVGGCGHEMAELGKISQILSTPMWT